MAERTSQEDHGNLKQTFKNIDEWNPKEDLEKVFQKKEEERKLQIRHTFIELTTGKDPHWSSATDLLCDYVLNINKIYTTMSDNKPEMWVYKQGVYIPEGKSYVMVVLRDVLKDRYSGIVLNRVLEKIQPDTFIEPEEFFNIKYKYEIPVLNGILNIETLEISKFTNKKIFFNKLSVNYIPGQECPGIDKFLRSILADEKDVDVFYEMVGFCLLKEYTFEKAFMLVGNGRNGKSKAMELIKRLISPENCTCVPLNSLRYDTFNISYLHNKMVNLAGDISNRDLKDTSMFKSCTGRDLIGANRKFREQIHFENYAKFIFACNELPMVYDLSRGFWDRWVLLEFPYTFIEKGEYNKLEDKDLFKLRDEDIISKITTDEELSGLLNMGLLGLHRLLKNKRFSSTKGTDEIKKMWIRKSNSFIAFAEEFIEEGYDSHISKKDLRKLYSRYCRTNKLTPKSDVVIKIFLQQSYGATEERKMILDYQEHIWSGIKLKENVN